MCRPNTPVLQYSMPYFRLPLLSHFSVACQNVMRENTARRWFSLSYHGFQRRERFLATAGLFEKGLGVLRQSSARTVMNIISVSSPFALRPSEGSCRVLTQYAARNGHKYQLNHRAYNRASTC